MRTIIIIIAVIIIFSILFGVIYFIESRNQLPPDKILEEHFEEDIKSKIDACIELGCEPGSIYVGSINSNKYYECSCHYAKRIKPENIICFATDEQAVADGRVKSEC